MINNYALIIPICTDLNRGDQALVLETAKIATKTHLCDKVLMMSDGDSSQCNVLGVGSYKPILEHPSRYDKSNKHNINYNFAIKVKWGLIAVGDFILSFLLLFKITRFIIFPFLSKEKKRTIYLMKKANAIFVKGGGFLHDYSGGPIGIYTSYFSLYHLILAQSLKKKVYIMPNSYGPFKSTISKWLVARTLKNCFFISSRESISANGNYNGLGFDIPLYRDLGFYLDRINNIEIKQYLTERKIDFNKNNYVSITVRPYRFYGYDNPNEKYAAYKDVFVKFTEYLNEKGFKPLFIVQTRAINDHENDEKCISEILKMIENKESYDYIKDDNLNCYDLKYIYSQCKYVIGTRFHSVIFSVASKIHGIAITYGGNKGEGIMKDMGLDEYSIKIGELTFEKLVYKFELMLNNEEEINKKVDDYIAEGKKIYNQMINTIINK